MFQGGEKGSVCGGVEGAGGSVESRGSELCPAHDQALLGGGTQLLAHEGKDRVQPGHQAPAHKQAPHRPMGGDPGGSLFATPTPFQGPSVDPSSWGGGERGTQVRGGGRGEFCVSAWLGHGAQMFGQILLWAFLGGVFLDAFSI